MTMLDDMDVSTRRMVLTGDGRAQLQARLDDDTTVLIALAERIGRGGLDPADLAEYARLLDRVEAMRAALRDAEDRRAVKE